MDDMTTEPPRLMSVEEFARVLGVSTDAARTICASECPPPHIRIGRERKVIRARVDQWLEEIEGHVFATRIHKARREA